jgi:hypothetical protein
MKEIDFGASGCMPIEIFTTELQDSRKKSVLFAMEKFAFFITPFYCISRETPIGLPVVFKCD